MVGTIVSVLLAGLLTENIVLSKILGVCPFINGSKKVMSAFSMSVAVTAVMIISTAVTYPLYAYILVPLGIEYLQTILFILVIVAIVWLLEIVLKKYVKSVYNIFGIYLPLITTNCAVLGITILHFTKGYSFVLSLVNALGAGLGFMLAMIIFAGVRSHLENADIPEFLKGLPITLIAAAIVSLAFLGFAGIAG